MAELNNKREILVFLTVPNQAWNSSWRMLQKWNLCKISKKMEHVVNIYGCPWEVNQVGIYNSLYSMNLYAMGKAFGHWECLGPSSLFPCEQAVQMLKWDIYLVRKGPDSAAKSTRGICVGRIWVGVGQIHSCHRSDPDNHIPVLKDHPEHV